MTEQWRERIGDYRLTREIGRGAFGIIYEARQISLNREVALKVLPASLFPDRETIERFRTEAMAVARLRHPHIVTVHEAGQDGDLHYFSMDLMGGRSLADVIAERGGMPLPRELEDSHFTSSMDAIMAQQHEPSAERPSSAQPAPAPAPPSREECFDAAAKLAGVADALHYAHEKGVIHQDVKPSNLVFDDEGRLCLLDFGTAQIRKRPHEEEAASGALGTPLYASPEQLDAGRGAIGPQTDVYSLGASLYEWATLRPPFVAEDYHNLRRKVLTETPQPAHEKNPAVPRELSAIIAKALARDPGVRYASAKDFADDLRRFLRRRPTLAGAAGPWRRLVLWSTRSPALAATLAAAVLLGLIAMAGLGYILLSHETLLDRVRAHFALGAWPECMALADQVPSDAPDWPEAMLLKADCLNQLDRHDERLAVYLDLLGHGPGLFDRSQLLMGKAKALADLRRHEDAERAFRQAIDAARDDAAKAAAHYELAKFLDDFSREDAALSEYAHAIELAPDLAKAQFAYGMLLVKKGEHAKAEPHLMHAVAKGGKDKPKYLAGIAEFYLAWGRPKDALRYADGAIAQARDTGRTRRTADYQVLKARILAAQQDYKDAIVLLQNAVDQADNRSEALYLLAMAQLHTGKDADARTTADEFLKPQDAIYPAMLWASLGEPDKALRYFQVLGPDDFARLQSASPALWQDLRRLMADTEAKDPAAYRKLAPAIEPYLR
ncbi:MAG TPA: hypothetical protein DCM87_11750 [Planctomycetes bacterium]|nr:hypothetical protein [Planctomycetota bacterium]